MPSSTMGRLPFFLYSVALMIAEAIAVVICVKATMGFAGFVHSKPGSSREGLALASFVVMMAFVVPRIIITWRRGKDAELSKWLIVPYLVLLTLFDMLQAATLLVYNFNTGSTNPGLGILSIVLCGLWFHICFARSRGGSFDPDAFLRAEGYGEVLGTRPAAAASASARTTMVSAPAIATPRAPSHGGAVVFGKRGRA